MLDPTLENQQSLTAKLQDFVTQNQPLVVLTGAGCSTESGIPDYRDEKGNWKHSPPILYHNFIDDLNTRKRYWLRSMAGWPRIASALPNLSHYSLAKLEHAGLIDYLITQNVDGLHRKAGSKSILDLHGHLDTVICMQCAHTIPRAQFQEILVQNNSDFDVNPIDITPDGDAMIQDADFTGFEVPNCPACDGILKPDVVFFGESVPKQRGNDASRKIEQAAGLLVIGSSLMVFSGYRFYQQARQQGKPVAIINLGRTRADNDNTLKVEISCSTILVEIANKLIQ